MIIWRKDEMPKAFVMVDAHFGREKEVLETLKKINGIKTDPVDGTCDFFVEVNTESMDKLKEIIVWQIRLIRAIRSTITLIVVEN